MSVSYKRYPHKFLTADFETSTASWLTEKGGKDEEARVWAYSICGIVDNEIKETGTNIDNFMDYFDGTRGLIVYFHNLKYDGQYIVDYLFRCGYDYVDDKKDLTSESFTASVTELGEWFEITVCRKVKGIKRPVKELTTFRDSLKKLPSSVKEIAKTFKLPILKGEIDYDLYREPGHKLTAEEIDYVENDVKIVAAALKIQYDNGYSKMTISSDAINQFKLMSGMTERWDFRDKFPKLTDYQDEFIRKSYRGGFTYCNPKTAGIEFAEATSYDVNSLYPSCMYGKFGLMPYGKPKRFNGKYKKDKTYPLYFQKFECSFKLRKNHVPMIQLKGNSRYGNREYIKESKGIEELTLNSVDMDVFFKHYKVKNIKYISGFKFMGSKDIFTEFIDELMYIKENSDGGERALAKLTMNSVYGKFGMGRTSRSVTFKYIDGKAVRDKVIEEKREAIYVPVASFTAAYGRRELLRVIQVNYKRFLYCDTDSVYLKGYEKGKAIEEHPTKLGLWEQEGFYKRSKYIRAKTYLKLDRDTDKMTVKCAGMPPGCHKHVTFENFKPGAKYPGKLSQKVVKGGRVLNESTYTVKINPDEIELEEMIDETTGSVCVDTQQENSIYREVTV